MPSTDLPGGAPVIERRPDSRTTPERRGAPIRHVTACVDGSAAGAGAVRHGVAVAAALHVPVTLLHVIEADEAPGPEDSLDWVLRRQEALGYLEQVGAAPAGAPDHVLDLELRQGNPAEQILQWVGAHGGGLTVLSRHGRHGQLHWSLSSTARKLVEGAPGSLLVVPAERHGAVEASSATYQHVMVPVDGSLRAESALACALAIARAHGAELLIAHAVPAPQLTHVGPPSPEDLDIERQVVARNEEVARGYLRRLRARLQDRGARVRTEIVRGGDVRERLGDLIRREGIDLVVMSSHGRTGARDTACGSVAHHLLGHVSVPLLILRDHGRRVLPASSPDRRREPRHPAQAG